jgi:hypothetical protein
MYVLGTDAPLWTRHDYPQQTGEALTSHAFVKNLKRYAWETGSLLETQEALDHEEQATTRGYLESISIKRDKYSERVSKRIDR